MSRVLVVVGDNKTCKSTLALTAPGKIGWQEFDIGGYKRAAGRFDDLDGRVVFKKYMTPMEQMKAKLGLVGRKRGLESRTIGVRELYVRATEDFLSFCEDPSITTIVWDNLPKFWRMVSGSVLQEKQDLQIEGWMKIYKNEEQIQQKLLAGELRLREQLLQIEYGEPNERVRNFINASKESDKNFVIIVTLDDERKPQLVKGEIEQVPTGKRVPAGWRWDHLKQEVDLVIFTRIEMESQVTVVDKKKVTSVLPVPYGKVTLSGEGLELLDLDIREPSWKRLEQLIKIRMGG
jgi:hypothetical protein